MSAVAAVVTLIGTAVSVGQQRKAVKAEEKARDTQSRIADVEAQRKRNLALRQARIQRARIANLAEQAGSAESSGALGAQASVGSQTNANLSFLDQTKRLSDEASGFLGEASSARSRAGTAGAIASVSNQFADFGSFGTGNIFNSNQGAQNGARRQK